jgi:transcriptional regulator
VYTPRAFASDDLGELDRLVARDPFVTVVTTGDDGAPLASHLPVLYRRDGERILIEGHWARPNPQARDADALLIVSGPHAYVSPGWYADKEPSARVPTWNYAVAHLYGRLRTTTDTDALASLVARLSERFESAIGSDWRYEETHRSQLRGIVAFAFEPARIELKLKLNQNHPPANVVGAAAGLRRLGGEAQREIAALMDEQLARRAKPEQ